jgi:hypothetical protein
MIGGYGGALKPGLQSHVQTVSILAAGRASAHRTHTYRRFGTRFSYQLNSSTMTAVIAI